MINKKAGCILFFVLVLFSFGLITCSTINKTPVEQTSTDLSASGTLSSSDKSLSQYEQMYEQLIHLEADFGKSASVQNFTFHRDVANFTLAEGKLYLCKPVMNRVCAAVFIGNGRFEFTPPIEVERKQLYRFYETESLNQEFKFLFIIFADNTLLELYKNLKFTNSEATGNVRSQIENALSYMGKPKRKEINVEIMKALLNVESNELFYASFSKKKSNPMFFVINPYEAEEVRLMRRSEDSRFGGLQETVCQFHKKADYKPGVDLSYQSAETIKVLDYKLDVNIAKNLDFSASAEIKFTSLRDRQKWIDFNLYENMEVDSVLWADGQKTQFFKGKENHILWVQCSPLLVRDQTYKIKIAYHGELIETEKIRFNDRYGRPFYDYNKDWLSIKSSIFWYPNLRNLDKATFDITFNVPEDFELVSVGKNIFSKTENKFTTARWVTSKPIRNASFNIGKFNSYKIKDRRIPPVTILTAKFYSEIIERYFRNVSNSEEMVGADIANSMNFFQEVYGKSPVENFYATEIPNFFHGEAFPGLISLTWRTFQSLETEGKDEIFRSHEVAHQWWGLGVDFRTYHDQWLCEGFATFSGLWYMQAIMRNNKKFFDVLKEWKDQIISDRNVLFKTCPETGPIWLGYRTGDSSCLERRYLDLIIYKKGAWVLHMLRNMMIDLDTMSDESFKNLMKDFYSTYCDKQASTYDFQKMLEKHVGMNMDWFFKEWVFGTDIPVYKFAYKTEKTPKGEYKVTCKVEQLDVPEDFQMLVPLHIKFEGDQFVKLRVLVKGPVSFIQLPLLPKEPEKIVFNDLESVLCKVKNVKWK